MEYFTRGNDIILKQPDLDLAETLDCGQAFRWTADGDGFTGFFLDRPLTILNEKDYFVLKNTSQNQNIRRNRMKILGIPFSKHWYKNRVFIH